MATLDLTLSGTDKTKIQTGLVTLKAHLDLRKEIWAKLPLEKRKAWVLSDKDDVITLAYDVYKYLDRNFFSREDG